MAPPNLPEEFWFIIKDQEDPWPTLNALQTIIDLDGMYDLMEAVTCQMSWDHAEALNSEAAANAARLSK